MLRPLSLLLSMIIAAGAIEFVVGHLPQNNLLAAADLSLLNAESNLQLRGGGLRRATVKRSRSPSPSTQPVVKKKTKQPAYNLPPAGWREKIKNPEAQRKPLSGKGQAHGRVRPSFHFWTKSRIKDYIEKRKHHQALVRKQQEKLPIKNFGRGFKRCHFKWLPSAYEKTLIEEAEKKKKEEAAAVAKAAKGDEAEKGDEEEQPGGDGAGDEDKPADDAGGGGGGDLGGGGGGGGGGEEEEFVFPGMMDGDSQEGGF